jgi:hypothetical protein
MYSGENDAISSEMRGYRGYCGGLILDVYKADVFNEVDFWRAESELLPMEIRRWSTVHGVGEKMRRESVWPTAWHWPRC